ncbi:hypothetical protein LTR66_001538 [Elasticomyces elasticus]|nr:hypothetical protein LTR28_007061 [Elasticomyces elasticus]KAK4999437.1 hypothetical protein LTR66_001538 [Elasticomyces elasticus]
MSHEQATNAQCKMSAATKYGLDTQDTSPIIVYPLHGSLTMSTTTDLCRMLDSDANLRLRTKAISHRASHVEILQQDTYDEQERAMWGRLPNASAKLAVVTLPDNGNFFARQFRTLYIVISSSR